MDLDENLPRRAGDPLDALMRQDLDPLSVAELDARVAVLEAEIVRTTAQKARSVSHRASADQLFRR